MPHSLERRLDSGASVVPERLRDDGWGVRKRSMQRFRVGVVRSAEEGVDEGRLRVIRVRQDRGDAAEGSGPCHGVGILSAQERLHKWWPAALDMFGKSTSTNAPIYVKWGIKQPLTTSSAL